MLVGRSLFDLQHGFVVGSCWCIEESQIVSDQCPELLQ